MTAQFPDTPPRASAARRRAVRPLVITGVVALVVGVGAGMAAAVTGSSSPSPSPTSPSVAPALPRLPGVHAFRGPGFGFGLRRPRPARRHPR